MAVSNSSTSQIDSESNARTVRDARNNGNGDVRRTKTEVFWRSGLSLSQLRDDINLSYADMPVLACCMVSGLCDSVAFNATGTFASMQTGNTIFLALGASRLPANQPLLWLRALVSIAAFWAGCLAFSKSRHFHPQRKATLSLAFLAQSACIFIAAALAQTQTVPAFGGVLLGGNTQEATPNAAAAENTSLLSLIPLALLAFQFGGQIVASRFLGIQEVPTCVLTSLYCDLLSDPLLLAGLKRNPKRNRRVAAIVLLVAGGIAGGWLQRSRAGMSAALWIAGGIKFAIALAWIAWRSRSPVPDATTGKQGGKAAFLGGHAVPEKGQECGV